MKSADIAASQQVPTSQIPGSYKLLVHDFNLDHTKKELSKPVNIELNADGTITGATTGTWSVTEGTSYISIKLASSSYTYEGVMVYQTLEPTTDRVMAFSAVNRNGVTIWGYCSNPVTGIESVNLQNQTGEDIIYDLQGRRVIPPLRHGIYIRNGKKIMIK